MKATVSVSLLLALCLTGCSSMSRTANEFATPDEAVAALQSAAKAGSAERLREVFGPESQELIDSGDPVADEQALKLFTNRVEQHTELKPVSPDVRKLVIGTDEFEFPIPLAQSGGTWKFDTAAGKEEILNRRIGENESMAIRTAQFYVDAQELYASVDRNGDGKKEFAAKVFSSPGKTDGLYWPRRINAAPSPLEPLIEHAIEEGYEPAAGTPIPFHGYLFRPLTEQGPLAVGGANKAEAAGTSAIGGFALLARPVRWGNSGVMSFVVNQHGIVYEKDLGPDTEKIADGISTFNPDETWSAAIEPAETAVAGK